MLTLGSGVGRVRIIWVKGGACRVWVCPEHGRTLPLLPIAKTQVRSVFGNRGPFELMCNWLE